jgi:uncharacterized protein YbjT (DUF2867 family)
VGFLHLSILFFYISFCLLLTFFFSFCIIENLAEQEDHVTAIRDEGKLYSATGDGMIPWVSADDIAAVAVKALTSEDPPNTEYLVLGEELLSYKDVSLFFVLQI